MWKEIPEICWLKRIYKYAYNGFHVTSDTMGVYRSWKQSVFFFRTRRSANATTVAVKNPVTFSFGGLFLKVQTILLIPLLERNHVSGSYTVLKYKKPYLALLQTSFWMFVLFAVLVTSCHLLLTVLLANSSLKISVTAITRIWWIPRLFLIKVSQQQVIPKLLMWQH